MCLVWLHVAVWGVPGGVCRPGHPGTHTKALSQGEWVQGSAQDTASACLTAFNFQQAHFALVDHQDTIKASLTFKAMSQSKPA